MSGPSTIRIDFDETNAVLGGEPPRWALGRLTAALEGAGIAHAGTDEAELTITVLPPGKASPRAEAAGIELPMTNEAFALFGDAKEIFAWGHDARGVAYALTELADRVFHRSEPFGGKLPTIEAPANRIRSITRIFANEREDKGWFRDKSMWTAYLDMLAMNRFNRFSLTLGIQYDYPYHNNIISDVYLHFPYPYLVALPDYGIKVRELPASETGENLETLKHIGREAARRGLDFQLGLWTQRYDFDDVPNATYNIDGVTEENLAPYCRDSVVFLLREVPQITGLTFRIHVEGGVSEGDYGFWRTVFGGIKSVGRPIEIDMHAKGLDDETLAVARESGMPVSVSPKYLAEHMGLSYHTSAIREREYPPKEAMTNREKLSVGTRRFTRQSYGDFVPAGRDWRVTYRMWPGTQRVLAWGDPALAAGYGQSGSFCGSDGIEWMEPLSFKGRQGSGITGGRTTYKLPDMATRYDWEKYLYQYRLWGRLTFNPDSDRDGWLRYLTTMCGDAAEAVERGMAKASRILPLVTHAHGPSIANNAYWPEIYTNMAVAGESLKRPMGFDMDEPTRFGNAPTFDPQMFANGREYATALLKGESLRSYTPLDVADWLVDCATGAESAAIEIRNARDVQKPAVQRLLVDMQILAAIGRFFAAKFRASCWGEIYLASLSEKARLRTVELLRQARAAWKAAIDHSFEVYQDDLTFGPGPHLRGAWRDRLADIDREVKELATSRHHREAMQASFDEAAAERAMAALENRVRVGAGSGSVKAPASFRRGAAVKLDLEQAGDGEAVLHYRTVDQSRRWSSMPMTRSGGGFSATIPAAFTDTAFHLQYYVSLAGKDGIRMIPGFNETLSNAPYALILQEV